MDAEQAMQEYISCVNVLDPEGNTKVMTTISEKLQLIPTNASNVLCYTTLSYSPPSCIIMDSSKFI